MAISAARAIIITGLLGSAAFSANLDHCGQGASDIINTRSGSYIIKDGTVRFLPKKATSNELAPFAMSLSDPSHRAILERQLGAARFKEIVGAPDPAEELRKALSSNTAPARDFHFDPASIPTGQALPVAVMNNAQSALIKSRLSFGTDKDYVAQWLNLNRERIAKEIATGESIDVQLKVIDLSFDVSIDKSAKANTAHLRMFEDPAGQVSRHESQDHSSLYGTLLDFYGKDFVTRRSDYSRGSLTIIWEPGMPAIRWLIEWEDSALAMTNGSIPLP